MADWQEDELLDCKGLQCPLPVIKTNKIIKTMEPGQILKMVSTDPISTIDMVAWSHSSGHELLESISDDEVYIFYIRKSF